ncbi:ABC transporter ATP-binding protein [Natronorubrum sp. FCH18a]|uniref:ABC transporter ATP-binding protein n=1 Tax=Natronorubrum sp. FCH18a TaxID=3447018 RepID=UPI003F513A6B
MILRVEGLVKRYGDLVAVDDISFGIEGGDFVTLLGPSGCGKSTILHTIAGFLEPTEGNIYLRGENVTERPPNKRNIGMSFQNTALFPHMTVRENISYGLRMRDYDVQSYENRVDEILELIDLPEHGEHNPSELSGGQQQRVSLGRAIAFEPDILLLDEPLTGLDRVLREEMRSWLKQMQAETDVTMLYVTHDQADALSMSDKVIVLRDAKKQQEADPKTIYEHPANSFVAEFVGKSTKFEGQIKQNGNRAEIETSDSKIAVDSERYRSFGDQNENEPVTGYVRPEDVGISTNGNTDGQNAFSGSVEEILDMGDRSEVTVVVSELGTVLVYTERFPDFNEGDEITVEIPDNKVMLP